MTIVDPQNTNNTSPTYRGQYDTFECGGTVAINDLVALTMATDGEIKCAAATTATHGAASKVGVATEAGVAGDFIQVITMGPALVNTPATGPSIGEVLVLTATAGVADGLAPAATDLVGVAHGVFLSDEVGTSNKSWAWING